MPLKLTRIFSFMALLRNYRYASLLIFFSWGLLMFAQSSVVEHDIEHNHHQYKQLCDSFTSVNHSAMLMDVWQPIALAYTTWFVRSSLKESALLTFLSVYLSRAPPSISIL